MPAITTHAIKRWRGDLCPLSISGRTAGLLRLLDDSLSLQLQVQNTPS